MPRTPELEGTAEIKRSSRNSEYFEPGNLPSDKISSICIIIKLCILSASITKRICILNGKTTIGATNFTLQLRPTAIMIPLSAVSTFYPPLNFSSFISNVSLGSYGGIYSVPSTRLSRSSQDGVYNYCSMPHPNEDIYSLPSPVADKSVEADLVYLEYLQRHQRRTPYNILPDGEVSNPTP